MRKFQQFFLSLGVLTGLAVAQLEPILNTGLLPGSAENTAEPNALFSTQNLQSLVYHPGFYAGAAPLDSSRRKPKTAMLVDYELQSFTTPSYNFEYAENSGMSNVFRVQWAMDRPGTEDQWGVRGALQILTVDYIVSENPAVFEDAALLNGVLGATWNRTFRRTMNQLMSFGCALDVLAYGSDFADKALLDSPIGAQLSYHASTTRWIQNHRLSGSIQMLHSFGGNLWQGYAGAAGEWIVRIHPRFDSRVTVLYKYLIYQQMMDQIAQSDPISTSNLFLGLGGVLWLRNGMGLDIAYRTTMMVPNLDTHTLQVGLRIPL